MTVLEAIKQNKQNIIIAKSVYLNGEKLPIKSFGWDYGAEISLTYRDGTIESFKIQKQETSGNTETFTLENNVIIQLDNYEDQEAVKQAILRKYSK